MDHKRLHKLEFHLRRIGDDPLQASDGDWRRVIELTQALLESGDRASDAAFSPLLRQASPALLARRVPENYTRLVRALAELLRAAPRPTPAPRAAPTEIEQLAGLLRGRALLVIGGDAKPEHAERLRASLELANVYWPRTSETRPELHALEPLIARDDVALVVLLIRWIRHALNDVADSCAKHDKPLARIRGGYNVSQIAAQALAQCGKRLER